MSGARSRRVLIWVQHLLGSGHLVRATVLARALAAAGFQVTLASGGRPVPGLTCGPARLVQLPWVASDESFSALSGEHGQPYGGALAAARRDRLLALLHEARPDVVMVEHFPFGRRPFRAELLPLLQAARALAAPPLAVVSVRDIVKRERKAGRHQEACDWIGSLFDAVLVHGDSAFLPFAHSFPLASALGSRVHHTGYVAAQSVAAAPTSAAPSIAADAAGPPRHGVIVAAGGGAAGLPLLHAAVAARALSGHRHQPWQVFAASLAAADRARLLTTAATQPPGLSLHVGQRDLAARWAGAVAAISQAGYNSAVELLAAATPAVLVPFVGPAGESEQSVRARAMAAAGRALVVNEDALSPAALAAALDALPREMPPSPVNLDGAAATARWLRQALAARPGP
ncbi:MAG: glycosyltransferase [Alphaproteobacteria bacterium]